MDGWGVSFGVTATLDGVGENDDGTVALLLLTCLGMPRQICHLIGIDPVLLHESSVATAIAVLCFLQGPLWHNP
jgi:hypothetical protein